MVVVIYGVPILVGFVLGYFFALHALILITLTCIGMGVYLAMTMKEMAGMFTVIFVFCALLGNGTMWVTYYVCTQQTWVGDFLHGYVLR